MSRPRIVCVLLALATFLLYSPTRHDQFLNYDDNNYVTDNPIVEDGLTWAGVKWAFGKPHVSNWHPLTWLSHMLDCQLFGPTPGPAHLVNALFHTLNTVLLFLLLRCLTGALWESAAVAALFAFHPLHVESVAWVAERKDVLSACFGLLTLMAYARFARKRSGFPSPEADFRPSATGLRSPTADYLLALLWFGLGLLAKPMLVTLPFVFLLLDYWPLRRITEAESRATVWRRLILEKWPFFALAAASSVVTFMAQEEGGSVAPLDRYPLDLRLENVVVAYAKYLFKTVWPTDLAVIYPLPRDLPWTHVALATVILVTLTWVIWCARRRRPYLLVGWLWFLGMLVPVIGLVQVGFQAMADRYTYVPLIGVFLGAVFGASDLAGRLGVKRVVLLPVCTLALAGCWAASARQLRFWRDSETLFAHAVAVTENNRIAQNNLGMAFLDKGESDAAIAHFRRALAIQPHYATALNNLGAAYLQAGQLDQAMVPLQTALEVVPDYPSAHNNLARALLQQGRLEPALAHFQRVLELQPDNLSALNNLAWVLATCPKGSVRDGARAIRLAEQANRLSRGRKPEILSTVAAAYAETGRFADALTAARQARELAALKHDTREMKALDAQIDCYQAGAPFRDHHLTKPSPAPPKIK